MIDLEISDTNGSHPDSVLEELLRNVRPATEEELKLQAENYGGNYKPGPRQARPLR